MSDWLEDAEGKSQKQVSPDMVASHVEQRRKLVKINYQKHAQLYDSFIAQMMSLVSRVNNLPTPAREPFGKLDGRPKKSKFDNNLFIFSSSYRFKKRKTKGAFRWFGFRHYKHIRVFYLSVSKFDGMADIEFKDYVLEKHRLGKKGEDKSTLHDHFLFESPIAGLNPDQARKIIDWLAFKAETVTLPFELKPKRS